MSTVSGRWVTKIATAELAGARWRSLVALTGNSQTNASVSQAMRGKLSPMGVRNGTVQSGGTLSADARDGAQARPRLLVVEDDPNIVELLSASLRFAGFDVATATSGSAALDSAKEAPARPGRARRDAARSGRLRGHPPMLREGGTRTPVVFLTARDATDDKIRGLTLGGDDYVTKPFSLEELTARIRAVLRRTGPRAGPVGRLDLRRPGTGRGVARGAPGRPARRSCRRPSSSSCAT